MGCEGCLQSRAIAGDPVFFPSVAQYTLGAYCTRGFLLGMCLRVKVVLELLILLPQPAPKVSHAIILRSVHLDIQLTQCVMLA